MLSDREVQVAALVMQYKENKEIAATLNISVRTVKFHVANILSKLKVTKRAMITHKNIAEYNFSTGPGVDIAHAALSAPCLKPMLSARDRAIVEMLEDGLSYCDIAREMGITRQRVRTLAQIICHKLGVNRFAVTAKRVNDAEHNHTDYVITQFLEEAYKRQQRFNEEKKGVQ